MIDLRSDTITRPTAAMREAMAGAPVGDDVYGEDPTVTLLEGRVAEMLGHEAGLYCATGSLANVLGVATHVAPGQEVLCDSGAHIARAEMGAHGAVSGITMRTWGSADGRVTPDRVEALLSPDAGPYLVSTACVEIENTHNFGGGTVQPWDALVAATSLVRDAGVGLHLDGARLWNAHVATGIGLREYGTLVDTVSVCFSKGLGAPMGSVLVGSREAIGTARVLRKRLGGGWRQAGIMAAACCTPSTITWLGWPRIMRRLAPWPDPSSRPGSRSPSRRPTSSSFPPGTFPPRRWWRQPRIRVSRCRLWVRGSCAR
ncbi:threonine aldolase family protein [Propioniciclava flava]